MRLMRGRWGLLGVALGAVVVGVLLARPFARGLAFVVRAADMQGVARRLADLDARAVATRDLVVEIPGSRTAMRARFYTPAGHARRSVLLVSGLHPAGIDEPRLISLSRQLAASGMAVLTPAIPELEAFSVTSAITDEIEAISIWMLHQSEMVGTDGRIGLVGISFSGGLSIVAAGRPSLRNKLSFVVALGGHDDLPRVLRYLCTGTEPYPRQQVGGEGHPFIRPPHDYGVAIILLGVAEKLVPPKQVEPLRAALRRFLAASALDSVDKPAAALEFASLRTLAGTLPEPSATLLTYVNNRDVIHLGARLLPYIDLYGGDAGLSASRSPKPSAPVFLLHGLDDNVIPTIESEYLADDLRGHAPVRLLLSGLITHTTVDPQASAWDIIQLADFWGDVLSR
jgi:hypothetical protein